MRLSEDAGTRKATEQILVKGKSLAWALAFTDMPKAPVLRSLRSMQSISESLSKLNHLPPPIGHAHFQLLATLMRQRQSSTTDAACLVLTQGMSVAQASAQTSASRSSVFRQVKRMQQLLEDSKKFRFGQQKT